MTAALAGAVELLDRSLAYTRVALVEVAEVPGSARTPCHGWPLRRLLAHLEDGLDAWTEAATGRVSAAPTPGGSALEAIRVKACDLLGWWLTEGTGEVAVGDRWLPADVLVGAASLEVTLHGWDLHATAGRPCPVPEPLAAPLLELARSHGADRLPCFAPPLRPVPGASSSVRLLRLLGRT